MVTATVNFAVTRSGNQFLRIYVLPIVLVIVQQFNSRISNEDGPENKIFREVWCLRNSIRQSASIKKKCIILGLIKVAENGAKSRSQRNYSTDLYSVLL